MNAEPALIARLRTILADDPLRVAALAAVRALDLADGWISAGFVRDAVWDHLHGRPPALHGDIDVIWFDPQNGSEAVDRALEARLATAMPGLAWSVKNQTRMHHRNADAPYRSSADAMLHWPETATAVAARLEPDGTITCLAPLGLDDLFSLVLRPAGRFADEKRVAFDQRVAARRWLARYPRLQLCAPL